MFFNEFWKTVSEKYPWCYLDHEAKEEIFTRFADRADNIGFVKKTDLSYILNGE